MKNNYLPLLLLLFSVFSKTSAQDSCLPDGITFTTQGQIDSFPLIYEDCSYILGSVRISGDDITNLDNLTSLDSIGGFLLIENNPLLVDLNGLQNLVSVGYLKVTIDGWLTLTTGLEIINNPILTSLSGLENLTTAKGCIVIDNNPVLSSLGALQELSSVGVCTFGTDVGSHSYESITISDNDELSSLNGLGNINLLEGNVKISGNDNLQNLEGLSNLASVANLSIGGNESLISTEGLNSIVSINGSLNISGNEALSTLDEFINIDSLSGFLKISGNSSLSDLSGFGNLVYVGRNGYHEYNGINISNNEALENLDGFAKIKSIDGCLVIENNMSLSSLSGLHNLDSIGVCILGGIPWNIKDGLTISNNPALITLNGLGNIDHTTIKKLEIVECPILSVCGVQSICDYLQNGGGVATTIGDNAFGCDNSFEVEEACEAIVGTNTITAKEIQIYPNPTTGIVNLVGINRGHVQVLNSLGNMLKQKEFTFSKIDLSELPKGIYFIKIQSGNQQISKKIIKL